MNIKHLIDNGKLIPLSNTVISYETFNRLYSENGIRKLIPIRTIEYLEDVVDEVRIITYKDNRGICLLVTTTFYDELADTIIPKAENVNDNG